MNSDQADDDTKVTHDKSRELVFEVEGLWRDQRQRRRRQRQKKKCKQREIRHVHLLVLARMECSR